MKRIVVALFALLIAAVAAPLSAADRTPNNIVDEVIRMWKANVGEEEIITYVHKADTRFRVSADDVIDMADAKVPRTVIKAVLDEADSRGDNSRPVERRTVVVPSYYGSYYGGWYPSYFNPWYSGYSSYYDPFWYAGPRFSVGIGFGFGHFRGGHFRRGRW